MTQRQVPPDRGGNGRSLRDYLNYRLARTDYRGLHLAQHNRLPEEKLVAILEGIHAAVGMERFEVPPGDDPNPMRRYDPARPGAAARWPSYNRVLSEINSREVSTTFNSFKKNHIPNLEGMGLLGRERAEETGAAAYARLSPLAQEILGARPTGRSIGIAQAHVNLFPANFIESLRERLRRLDSLNVYEMQLIVSDPDLSGALQEQYVREYRRLRPLARLELLQELRDRCLATMDRVSKRDKRDWDNWNNQAEQIMSMLTYVSGLTVYDRTQVTLAGSRMEHAFRPTRSSTAKAAALEWHGLTSGPGWEVHHIVPVSYATCRADLDLIDARENLIQLSSAAHRRIPTRNNRAVALRFDATHVTLSNPVRQDGEPSFSFELGREARVDRRNLQRMTDHNRQLLQLV